MTKVEVKRLILDNICEPPSRLKLILKRNGLTYVTTRKGVKKYIVRSIKDRSQKFEIKL